MAESIFVDTGYIIAMLVPTDEHRVAAARWTRDIAKTRTPLVIMQDRGITRALSCDQDFQQAGFRALLIED